MAVLVPRDDEETRGISIQAMNDARPLGVYTTSELLAELRDERRTSDPGRRMNHEPRRLLDD